MTSNSPVSLHSRLKGKTAILTGAGSGIGRATAVRFAQEGARLGLTDINVTGLDETARIVRGLGGEVIARAGDIVDPATIDQLATDVATTYGGIDVLVNIAGIVVAKPFLEQTAEDFDRLMRVNVLAAVLASQRVIPEMQAAGQGSIIHFASVGGLIGLPGLSLYNASKAAVIGLTRGMALDQAPHIRVNAVAPGGVKTPMSEEHIASFPTREEAMNQLAGRQLIKRFAEPEEVTGAVVFLASDDSAFMTGAVIPVEGGWTAW
ncbi:MULTISPECIES: SDR family NAD(P)-dependent oxidoreductase [unclassified Rhodococcus (in: high G+C Gram-positive bacteria)]|uniref:SDR family NAD(P)-dependent oxidoreductase n=1 Tax=unclassified Rhodococcus (in: high G+C Gram-positive bacteria) TaxID=192944 RepID=UPI0015E8CDCA|nr:MULTISPECIES: SDR family oxidoreductase [unclassified Rhodococcus (in: high G+C Gram-positive bacteria)]